MKCPVDKQDMIVVEHHQIELDFCLKCAGVWFDSGEFDLLLNAFQKGHARTSGVPGDSFLPRKDTREKEATRRCPFCGMKMDKARIGKDPGVLIDTCPAGDGIWFDGGELHQVLTQTQGVKSEDVLAFLGDAFKATYQTESK